MIGALLGLWLLAAPTPAAQPPPSEVGALLTAMRAPLEASDARAALDLLQAYAGPAHPLVDLARGHALTLADRHDEAIAAYRAAVAGDPTSREAGMGLVGALARGERWSALCAELPRWQAVETADAPTLRLWAAAALGAGDMLLAEEVARRAVVRFPNDDALRRALAHALSASGRPAAAAATLRRLLDVTPGDGDLWQQLAVAAPAVSRPALEAAVLADPEARAPRRRLVTALLAAGQGAVALRYAAALLDGRADAVEPADRLLAVQAAVAAGETQRAGAWLVDLPDADPRARRLKARVALTRGDAPAARAELAALLAAGEVDVLLPLAALERAAGRWDRAEALLRQASALERPGAAPLHLAHLLLRRGRRAEAAQVLRQHLARAPADGAARVLLDSLAP